MVESEQFTRPCRGQKVSGDTAVIEKRDRHVFAGIVDVLGHGPEAHELAVEIDSFLRQSWTPSVTDTLEGLHETIKGSRGAAAGLAVLDADTGELRYCGVGNTVIRRLGPRPATLASRDGIIGGQMRTPREEQLQLTEGDVVLLYTDGVRTHFALEEYPELLSERAGAAAANVVRRFGKEHDDASCIVLRYAL